MERSDSHIAGARRRVRAAGRTGIALALLGVLALTLSAVWRAPAAAAEGASAIVARELRAVSEPLLLVGSDAGDVIRISEGDDGSLTLAINGTDTVVPAGDVRRLVIDALEGNDTVLAEASVTLPLTILGGPGDDKIVGGAGDDYIDGGEGHDLLFGGDGNDVLYGGLGNDVLIGAAGDDYLDGGPGNDALTGGDGNDVLFGGQGDDSLSGGAGDDVMAGGPGVDSFVGGSGAQKTFAQRTDDQPFGAPGAVTWVNPNPLGPADQVAGSSVVDDDDLAFSERVQADLQSLLSIPSGRRLLQRLDAAGKRIVLRDSNGGNATTILDTAAALLRTNGQTGPGSACTLFYNIMGTVAGDGSQDWMHRPPIVGLYHELVHALNAATGTIQPGQTDGVANLELQAIGLPFVGIAWDNDGDPATPTRAGNLPVFTENGFRALLGLTQRPLY